MRSLLLVESFDLCPSNQYILVRMIPSCFRFAKMCLCQVSLLSRCSPRYLTSSCGSCTLFIWAGGHVSLCVVNVLNFESCNWYASQWLYQKPDTVTRKCSVYGVTRFAYAKWILCFWWCLYLCYCACVFARWSMKYCQANSFHGHISIAQLPPFPGTFCHRVASVRPDKLSQFSNLDTRNCVLKFPASRPSCQVLFVQCHVAFVQWSIWIGFQWHEQENINMREGILKYTDREGRGAFVFVWFVLTLFIFTCNPYVLKDRSCLEPFSVLQLSTASCCICAYRTSCVLKLALWH
jgi:hypothetical protein